MYGSMMPPTLSRSGSPRRRLRGFTLIELMIAVAVVAILAAIGYPSYTEHIRKSRRATAQAALMDLASRQQAYLLDRRAYAGFFGGLGERSEVRFIRQYGLDGRRRRAV